MASVPAAINTVAQARAITQTNLCQVTDKGLRALVAESAKQHRAAMRAYEATLPVGYNQFEDDGTPDSQEYRAYKAAQAKHQFLTDELNRRFQKSVTPEVDREEWYRGCGVA